MSRWQTAGGVEANLVFGYDKHTTFWFGKPGERWTGKVIDTFTHAKDLLEDV